MLQWKSAAVLYEMFRLLTLELIVEYVMFGSVSHLAFHFSESLSIFRECLTFSGVTHFVESLSLCREIRFHLFSTLTVVVVWIMMQNDSLEESSNYSQSVTQNINKNIDKSANSPTLKMICVGLNGEEHIVECKTNVTFRELKDLLLLKFNYLVKNPKASHANCESVNSGKVVNSGKSFDQDTFLSRAPEYVLKYLPSEISIAEQDQWVKIE